MNETRAAVVVGAVAVLVALGGVGLALGWGAAERAHWVGPQLVRIGTVGLIFMAGFVAGGMLLADRRSGGGGENGHGGDSIAPAPDPIQLELQRILDEESTSKP